MCGVWSAAPLATTARRGRISRAQRRREAVQRRLLSEVSGKRCCHQGRDDKLYARQQQVDPRLDRLPLCACLSLVALALLVRLINLAQLPDFDELYTLPAAQNMLVEGVPRIADGVYDRAILYTMVLAEWFRVFGDSLVVARLFSVLSGVLLVVAVFLWTDGVAGRVAAWIAALFVVFDPLAIHVSQFARFYSLHALLFWLGAISVYSVVIGPSPVAWRAGLALVAMVLLGLAVHLQVLTMLGLAGMATWVVGVVAWRLRAYRRWLVAAASTAAVAGAVVVLMFDDAAQAILHRYLETPLSVEQYRGHVWFYHVRLIERYPALWPIVPFLAIVAASTRPRPTFFALAIFGAVLVMLSFGGPKNWRYLFFALPFLFVIWAIALAALWEQMRATIMTAADRLLNPVNGRGRGLLLASSCAFLVLANGAATWTLLHPFGLTLGREAHMANWPLVVGQLSDAVADADIVLSSHEVYTLHYFGRTDVTLSKRRLAEFGDRQFERDPRTGIPTISTTSSLERLMSCHANGLILLDAVAWRDPTMVDEDVSGFIAAHADEIPLPERSRVLAFRWHIGPLVACR